MPASNPVTDFLGYTPAAGSTSATSRTSSGTASMGKDDFLKLFVAQMRQQNPMQPTDDKEAIGQMTQFSMLEQLTNVAKANDELAASTRMSQAVGLLGRTVTYLGADGAMQTGVVERVLMKDGTPNLTVGGVEGVTTGRLTEVR